MNTRVTWVQTLVSGARLTWYTSWLKWKYGMSATEKKTKRCFKGKTIAWYFFVRVFLRWELWPPNILLFKSRSSDSWLMLNKSYAWFVFPSAKPLTVQKTFKDYFLHEIWGNPPFYRLPVVFFPKNSNFDMFINILTNANLSWHSDSDSLWSENQKLTTISLSTMIVLVQQPCLYSGNHSVFSLEQMIVCDF